MVGKKFVPSSERKARQREDAGKTKRKEENSHQA